MSAATRATRVVRNAAAARIAERRVARPNGWWGMALFVATEAGIFGSLIAGYFYLSFRAGRWPPAPIAPPSVALPLALTAALVATTFPLLAASRAARAGRLRAARGWILGALAVQGAYVAAQAVLYADDLRRFSPRDSAYGSMYFTLLGAHHAHVVVGIGLSVAVLVRLAGGLT
ncbi:MAG TPA: cytochrome c oxidase subunit 3, partial [Solirubrobacteraceae bacterium]